MNVGERYWAEFEMGSGEIFRELVAVRHSGPLATGRRARYEEVAGIGMPLRFEVDWEFCQVSDELRQRLWIAMDDQLESLAEGEPKPPSLNWIREPSRPRRSSFSGSAMIRL